MSSGLHNRTGQTTSQQLITLDPLTVTSQHSQRRSQVEDHIHDVELIEELQLESGLREHVGSRTQSKDNCENNTARFGGKREQRIKNGEYTRQSVRLVANPPFLGEVDNQCGGGRSGHWNNGKQQHDI